MRQFIIIALPLLIPTVLYLVWWQNARRKAEAAGNPDDAPKFGDVPWVFIVLGGLGLLTLGGLALTLSGGAEPNSKYIPAQIIDGKIVPGHHVPAGTPDTKND